MWDIAKLFNSVDVLAGQSGVTAITSTNRTSTKHGLVLSQTDAMEIIESRNLTLNSLGRVELGLDIIIKLISVFCSSPYINQSEYAGVINDLVEGFYYFKNETLDQIDDDELIAIMKECFDNRCHGSVDLLLNRELDNMARYMRQDFPAIDLIDNDEV
jgi:hypothetical protein